MRRDWQSALFEQSMLANPTSMLFFMAGTSYNIQKIFLMFFVLKNTHIFYLLSMSYRMQSLMEV